MSTEPNTHIESQSLRPSTRSLYPAPDRKYLGTHQYTRTNIHDTESGQPVKVTVGTETFEGQKAIFIMQERQIDMRYGVRYPQQGLAIYDANLGSEPTYVSDLGLMESLEDDHQEEHIRVVERRSGQSTDPRFTLRYPNDPFKEIAEQYHLNDAPFLGYRMSAKASDWSTNVVWPLNEPRAPVSMWGVSTMYFADPGVGTQSSAPQVSRSEPTTAGCTKQNELSEDRELSQGTSGHGAKSDQ
ncbi:hypothetical protein IAT40_004514 [Kwoniella sp. CBS 6097]